MRRTLSAIQNAQDVDLGFGRIHSSPVAGNTVDRILFVGAAGRHQAPGMYSVCSSFIFSLLNHL